MVLIKSCRVLFLFNFSIGFLVFVTVRLDALEYTVRGTVASKTYFYDENGNLKKPSSDVQANSICDFVFLRSGEKWRLDIVYPDPDFPIGSVWRTITPIVGGGFVSVISFPPKSHSKNGAPNKSNAYVNVITNVIMPNEDAYGAHAIWLVFNLDTLSKKYVSLAGCPPFWQFDPVINDLNEKTHNVVQTNGAIQFWCNGSHLALNSAGKIKFENGQPVTSPYPAPVDKGFMEAEYLPSSDYLDKTTQIPKNGVLTFWNALHDNTSPNGVRLVVQTELRIENKTFDTQAIVSSTFVPSWTNSFAAVSDPRGSSGLNQPLSYVTKAKHLDLSQNELLKQQNKYKIMLNSGLKLHTQSVKRPIILMVLIGSILPLLVLRKYFREPKV